MKLTDTHSHLYDTAFDADREEALARAAAAGVEHLLLPGIDSESHGALFDLCRRHPGQCVPMMGLHPTSVNDNPHWREELALAERYLTAPPEGIAPNRSRLSFRNAAWPHGSAFRWRSTPVRHGTTCAGSSGRKRRPRRRPGGGCGACSTPFRRMPSPTGH